MNVNLEPPKCRKNEKKEMLRSYAAPFVLPIYKKTLCRHRIVTCLATLLIVGDSTLQNVEHNKDTGFHIFFVIYWQYTL